MSDSGALAWKNPAIPPTSGGQATDMGCSNEEAAPIEPGAKSGHDDGFSGQQGGAGLNLPPGPALGGW